MCRLIACLALVFLTVSCGGDVATPPPPADQVKALGVYAETSRGLVPLGAYATEGTNRRGEVEFDFNDVAPAIPDVTALVINMPDVTISESRLFRLPSLSQVAAPPEFWGRSMLPVTIEQAQPGIFRIPIPSRDALTASADGPFLAVRLAMPLGTPSRLYALDLRPDGRDIEAQKLTVRRMRNLGVALMAWLSDQRRVSASSPNTQTDAGVIVANQYPTDADPADVLHLLRSQRVERAWLTDGWGRPLNIRIQKDLSQPRLFFLRSSGRDGEFESDRYTAGRFDPPNYDEDIVWADGFFVRWPQRAQ